MRVAWLLGLSLAWCQTFATTDEIVFNDAINDDAGDGSLIYPQRHDFQPGDLDLTKISIRPETGGYRFIAEFKNPVRDPAKVTTDSGPEPLSDFARKGFYSFNLDIYIDHDHIKSSGNTFTLPGRHADIADDHAWEHAIILTPRPDLMRAQLIATLQQEFAALPAETVTATVNKLVLFPERIQVRNKTVSFFVPAAFIGATADTWALTAFVTGAKTTIESTWSLGDTAVNSHTLELGVMQPEPGLPKKSFGYRGKTAPSPIVDVLADSTETQIRQLSAVPVKLSAAGNPMAQTNSHARAITSWGEALGAAVPATISNKAESASQITPVMTTTVERLKTLEALFDQHIITEDEYLQQRQRILNEL